MGHLTAGARRATGHLTAADIEALTDSDPYAREPRAAQASGDTAFGRTFSETLLSMRWAPGREWHDARLSRLGPRLMHPGTVGLHYGQVVFEGLKAYRLADGRVGVFRMDAHARRLCRSAERIGMPQVPAELFCAAVRRVVRADERWVPDDEGLSLYLRPLLFARDESLALRPADEYEFLVMAFVTEDFFGTVKRAVKVWIDERFSRAAPGGTGAVKYAGNYAAAYQADRAAAANGCDQVVWLDAVERRWVEELGAMNIFFVHGSGAGARVVTPPLTGTILPGITRDCVMTLSARLGYVVEEAPVSVEVWTSCCLSGEITETFATGTAAGVCPVGEIRSSRGAVTIGDGTGGPVAAALAEHLRRYQRGRADDLPWLSVVPGRLGGRAA